jgi:hypothetical protein
LNTMHTLLEIASASPRNLFLGLSEAQILT